MSKRLLRPLDYLRIKHDDKARYDLLYPLLGGLALTILLFVLPGSPKLLGQDGLLSIFTGLLQILAGFYIASLAAVSTFSKPSMDETMAGDPPTLKDRRRRQIIERELTRREFLSMMFGYLALLSIVLYLVGAFANLVGADVASQVALLDQEWVGEVATWLGVFAYLFAASNLLVTTMLGLFYMSDRIHRE